MEDNRKFATFFADAFNYLIYNGKMVIDPAKLKEIDPFRGS